MRKLVAVGKLDQKNKEQNPLEIYAKQAEPNYQGETAVNIHVNGTGIARIFESGRVIIWKHAIDIAFKDSTGAKPHVEILD